MRTFARVLIAAVMLVGFASVANAGTITCPVPDPGNQLKIDWTGGGTAECTAMFGDHPAVHFPNGSNTTLLFDGTNYPYIGECDGSDCSVTGGISGTFSFVNPGDYLALFKFGGGQNSPDWFVVFLSGISSGTWALLDGDVQNGLSHMAIWGIPGDPTDPTDPNTPVPEPASLMLLGSGLLAAAAARRRFRR